MKFEVTLAQLREHKACVAGYNKVVCSLKKTPYAEKETYISYKHTEPISLLSILESNGLDDALWCLRCNDKEWARDSRLFAVWCARQVQHLMTDSRSLKALDIAEAYANGQCPILDLEAARDAAGYVASAAYRAVASAAGYVAGYAAWNAAWDAAKAVARADAWDAVSAAQKEMFIKMCNGEAPWQKGV